MGKAECTQGQKRYFGAFARKAGEIFENSVGILLAFGIAFGELFLVQSRLVQEEAELLQGGGMIEIQVQPEAAPAQEIGETETVRAMLTDAQLYRVVEKLEREVEAYPHEPWEGQLSMAEAVAGGKEWIEGFLLPSIGINDIKLSEYSINCYLWAWQSDVEAGDRDPVLSYWKLWFHSQGLGVDITLNAATGQVLDAAVSCSSALVEYQDPDDSQVKGLLYAFADSFGLEGRYMVYDVDAGSGWSMYEGIGEEGVFVAAKAYTVAVSMGDGGYGEYSEIFHIDLRLGTE